MILSARFYKAKSANRPNLSSLDYTHANALIENREFQRFSIFNDGAFIMAFVS